MSPVTTHILDTAKGCPAAGVNASLSYRDQEGRWQELARGETNRDGRIADWLPPETSLQPGRYRIQFQIGAYFEAQRRSSFYPEAIIVFNLQDPSQHYHVPLLISDFGYTTYRGS